MTAFVARFSRHPGFSRCVCLVLLFCLTGILGGCGDEVTAPESAEEIPTNATQTQELANKDWLSVHDKISPAQWLASRETGHDVDLGDPRVKELHKMLQDAKGVFGTPYRMTANRAVQLEEMIGKEGWDPMAAPDLITTFTRVGVSDTSGEGFGQLAQAYFQLRKQGLGHEAALDHIEKEAKESRQ